MIQQNVYTEYNARNLRFTLGKQGGNLTTDSQNTRRTMMMPHPSNILELPEKPHSLRKTNLSQFNHVIDWENVAIIVDREADYNSTMS